MEDPGREERRVWLMWLIATHQERGLTVEERDFYNTLREEDIRLTGGNWISLDEVEGGVGLRVLVNRGGVV